MKNMADKSFREVTVFDFFTAFRLNFKSIFLSSFAVTLVAIIYSLLVTPIFSSTALITLNKDIRYRLFQETYDDIFNFKKSEFFTYSTRFKNIS